MTRSLLRLKFGFINLDLVSLASLGVDRKTGERVLSVWVSGDSEPLTLTEDGEIRSVWSAMSEMAGQPEGDLDEATRSVREGMARSDREVAERSGSRRPEWVDEMIKDM